MNDTPTHFSKRSAIRYTSAVLAIPVLTLALLWAAYFAYRLSNHSPQATSAATMGTTTPEENDAWTTSKQILEKDEALLPTYDQFLGQLQQTCPYYQAGGAQYRECLANLLTIDDSKISAYSAGLIRDLKALPATSLGAEALVADLRALEGAWKPYRDALCAAELEMTLGGSNQSGLTTTCKLYQDALYYTRLGSLRDAWIH